MLDVHFSKNACHKMFMHFLFSFINVVLKFFFQAQSRVGKIKRKSRSICSSCVWKKYHLDLKGFELSELILDLA